jgi:hypothetical protein
VFKPDARMVAFLAIVTVGTGVLFGLFPALHSTGRISRSRSRARPASPAARGRPNGFAWCSRRRRSRSRWRCWPSPACSSRAWST